VSNLKSTKPDGPNIPTAKGKRSPNLQEIEETETSLWVGHQCCLHCLISTIWGNCSPYFGVMGAAN